MAAAKKAGKSRLVAEYEGQLERALTNIPSPLEYFGFIFHFASFLAGPAMEIKSYLQATETKESERPKGRFGYSAKVRLDS